ncbi:MAG: glycosyltransferase, partial [Clostridiales bacterium]|nr:glycosyltransferase [Clostridiales bacterium]
MLLSIGMIVKNEEKTLRACLEGIKPILEQVESELIIADTGSTDRTADIAKEFTRNVYQIEWRDDFAWARNTTLERASGEWFMFLDADEVFKDVSGIIRFFNSGEYKGYKCASHLRYETGGGTYTTVTRLYKKQEGKVFKGRIHEFIPIEQPRKKLEDCSFHTGYDSGGEGSEDKVRDKADRNLRYLALMHEETPGDLRIISEMVDAAMMKDDYEQAGRFLQTGLSLQGKDSVNVFYHAMRRQAIVLLVKTGRDQDALDEIRDYFTTSKKLFTLAIFLRHLEAKLLAKLGRREEAAAAYTEMKKLFDDYNSGKLSGEDIETAISGAVPPDTGAIAAKGIASMKVAAADKG